MTDLPIDSQRATAETRADRGKNCLYVTLVGFFNLEAAERAIAEISSELRELRPGFTVISDISKVKTSSEEVAARVEDLFKQIDRSGVSRVFRVVSAGSAVARMQHARLQREAGVGYEVTEVASVEEAERLMAESASSE